MASLRLVRQICHDQLINVVFSQATITACPKRISSSASNLSTSAPSSPGRFPMPYHPGSEWVEAMSISTFFIYAGICRKLHLKPLYVNMAKLASLRSNKWMGERSNSTQLFISQLKLTVLHMLLFLLVFQKLALFSVVVLACPLPVRAVLMRRLVQWKAIPLRQKRPTLLL